MQVKKDTQQSCKTKSVTTGKMSIRKNKHRLNSDGEKHSHLSLGRSNVTLDHAHSKISPLATAPSAAKILVDCGAAPSAKQTTPIGKSKHQTSATDVAAETVPVVRETDLIRSDDAVDGKKARKKKKKTKKKREDILGTEHEKDTRRKERKRKRTLSDSLSFSDRNDGNGMDGEDDTGDIDVVTPLSGHAPLSMSLKELVMKEGQEKGGTSMSERPKKKRRRDKNNESLMVSIGKDSVSKWQYQQQQPLECGSPSGHYIIDHAFSMTTPITKTSPPGRLSPVQSEITPEACQVKLDGLSTKLIIRSDRVRKEKKKKKHKKHKKKAKKSVTKEENVSDVSPSPPGEMSVETTPTVSFTNPLKVTIKIDGNTPVETTPTVQL